MRRVRPVVAVAALMAAIIGRGGCALRCTKPLDGDNLMLALPLRNQRYVKEVSNNAAGTRLDEPKSCDALT